MKKALNFFYVCLAFFLIALAYNTFNNKNKTDMKRIINTSNAPKPIGPYNQAVISGDLMFISGQVAFDPNTDELVLDDIQTETKQVMENLKSILEEANLSFKNVVKTTIFLSDMDDFQQVNEVYGSYFSNDQAPARETVEVSRLPKDVNVEISMIAYK
jgi:2-iminobutanoate/2-iminopropanoate deaminase